MTFMNCVLNTSLIDEVPLSSVHKTDVCLAQAIMLIVSQYRRMTGPKTLCSSSVCEPCFAPHLDKLITAIQSQVAIEFVLPAFPAKSPNSNKVLGTLPDKAEKLSLEFLQSLCQQIQTIYDPGARVILCSDGRVFNDVIGILDDDVTHYQQALSQMIKQMNYQLITTFNLDNVYSGKSFNDMRDQLMSMHGESLEDLQEGVRRGSKSNCNKEDEELHRQYCGITRFLVEDAMHPEQTQSRTSIQKASRKRAYIVIQRSRAWSAYIAEQFPLAIRLSIHPQTCGSSKLGIHLMEAESWMTPWHGVAVNVGGSFILIKRAQAEALNAQLIYQDGHASHYQLNAKENRESNGI